MQIGKYHIEQKLGSGGTGDVYLSQHPQLNYRVAIKLIHTPDATTRAGFLREAQTAALLSHHNIINILDVDEANGQLFIVMEQFPRSLEDVLQGGPLPVLLAVELAIQLLNGLAYAHRQGIIHRDIKPANVLLRDDDTPVLADFGLARPRNLQKQTGSLAGTPAYVAPEQIRGQPTDERTDIYTFGAMLYEMLTGRVPFAGDSAAMLVGHMQQAPVPPKQYTRSIPDDLSDLVLWMLEKDPARRPQSVQDVLAALTSVGPVTMPHTASVPAGQRAATGPTVALKTGLGRTAALTGMHTPAPPVPQPKQRPVSTRTAMVLVGVLVALGLSCIAGGVMLSNNAPREQTSAEDASTGQQTSRDTSFEFELEDLTPVALQPLNSAPMHNAAPASNTADFSYGGVTTRREDERLLVLGEIRNETQQDRTRLEVRVLLKGTDGRNYIASDLVDADRIRPGEIRPFEVAFRGNNPPPADFTSVAVDVLSAPPTEYDRVPLPESAITLDGPLQIGLRNEFSSLTIQGTLKNTLSQEVTFPRIVVTLYNSEGDVIDVLDAYGRTEVFGNENYLLPAGESVPFRISSYLDDTAGFSSYRVAMDAAPVRED